MSSPREASPCEAVIVQAAPCDGERGERGDAPVGGPLRLPRLQQADFVQQFNQLYGALGMRLELLPGDDASAAYDAQFQSILRVED